MSDVWTRVEEAAAAVRSRVVTPPQIAVVLGSGLGEFADAVADQSVMPYSDLPHWPHSRVMGHSGKLVVGTVAGRRIAVLAGRSHYYEDRDFESVVFATRVMGRLGVKELILTNAAGGVNLAFGAGALMIIDDHINLLGTNPLLGENDERFGPRFPDMSEVYSARLRRIADEAASVRRLQVTHGVYAALPGPSYETPAEVRYLRLIGADAVGMSTVPEAIVARHMSMEVLGISCISNVAAGILPHPIKHEEALEVTHRIRGAFMSLLEGIIEQL